MPDSIRKGSKEIPIHVLPGRFAVCQLASDAAIPAWALGDEAPVELLAVVRTRVELSIVCSEERVPPDAKCQRGWRGLKLEGPFDFGQVGILSSVLKPLAEAGVSIFATSTYNTDYVLVRAENLEKAVAALAARGFPITRARD